MSGSKNKIWLKRLVLLSVVLFLSSSVVAANSQEVMGADNSEGFEIVAGYFRTITYEGNSEDTTILLECDGSENYSYEWTYNGDWTGDVEYLMESESGYENGVWNVRITVDHDAPVDGDWTLTIDGETEDVLVLEPSTPVGASGGPLSFLIEPYSDGGIDGHTIRVPSGNVLGEFEAIYDNGDFDGDLNYDVESNMIEPHEDLEVDFWYSRSTGQPEVESLDDILLTVTYQDKLDLEADGNVVVGSEKQRSLSGTLVVGYEGYEREFTPSYDIQYKEETNIDGDTTGEVTFFVYPHEEVDVHYSKENIEVEETSVDLDESLSPEEDEVVIEFTYHSDYQEDGEITLIIDGDRYTTEISIDEPAPLPEENNESLLEEHSRTVMGGVVFVVLVGIMAVRYWKE